MINEGTQRNVQIVNSHLGFDVRMSNQRITDTENIENYMSEKK